MVLSYFDSTNSESALWTKNLASSAINAFDVFRPSFEDPSMFKDPPPLVLIRQPPSPFFSKRPGRVTTFLNTTEEGAWYALSTDRYPLLTSRVQAAPWVTASHGAEDRNATKEDLVGIHPIARTVEMNIDNPGLPAPSMPKLIEGGDWQSRHHGQMGLIKENPWLLFAAIGIFFWAIWKRRTLMSVRFRRRNTVVENIEETPQEIVIEKPPVPVEQLSNEIQEATRPDVIVEAQENDEPAPAPEKKPRRKRGQRGGKNNKKKVGFTEDVDDDDQGEEANGFVQVPMPNAIPKDMPLNDQGDYTLDGLTVTDKLLGTYLCLLINEL
jgi:hypothetical protein